VDHNFGGIDKMRALMVENGDSHKRAWIGETGYSHVQTWMKAVPDSTRAVWLKEAYSLASQRPWVAGLSWFSFQDTDEWDIVSDANVESQTFKSFREVTIRTLVFSPVADARVEQAYPANNFGASTTLTADANPSRRSFLKFDVSGLGSNPVMAAKLRLYVTDGTGNGPSVRTSFNSWTETGVTWNTRPASKTDMEQARAPSQRGRGWSTTWGT
jgi:hypothetical protein